MLLTEFNVEEYYEVGVEEGMAKGVAKGRIEGVVQEKKETARRMKARGRDIDEIAEDTGLSRADIEAL